MIQTIPVSSKLDKGPSSTLMVHPVSTDLRARARTFCELMDVRDGILALPGVRYLKIESSINFFAVNLSNPTSLALLKAIRSGSLLLFSSSSLLI